MLICPLAEDMDQSDHYLAFINLDNFDIVAGDAETSITVRQLRDIIQLSLLQQSEYLRRLCLAFSCKVVTEYLVSK